MFQIATFIFKFFVDYADLPHAEGVLVCCMHVVHRNCPVVLYAKQILTLRPAELHQPAAATTPLGNTTQRYAHSCS